ncbi:C4-dicarboxylate ABC transporter substrate-binding protein, partial [Thioclava sp. BHET1]
MTRPIQKIAFALVASMAMAGVAHAKDYKFKFQSSDPAGNPNFVLQQD